MGKVKMSQISLYLISVLLIYALKKLRIINFHLSTPKCYIQGQLQSRETDWSCESNAKITKSSKWMMFYSEGKPLLSITAMNWYISDLVNESSYIWNVD